ncbi:DUF6364 family protein [Pinibacter aurantiacus]|uniref:Uncharacterized protein n=1 Tax=Pinibacter aurantiacus TaxID=2851599 RepID=A0A9E2W3A0_9BACT|nr:DUF6364 family protein [Pinibacter aurantiacus]MBV4356013.1 hypothetical protein [Pinibacter aurantiacus]
MKAKLTLSIDSTLIDNIKKKARLDKSINISKMVEEFLMNEFGSPKKDDKASVVKSLRGILKGVDDRIDWKDEKYERIVKKHLK